GEGRHDGHPPTPALGARPHHAGGRARPTRGEPPGRARAGPRPRHPDRRRHAQRGAGRPGRGARLPGHHAPGRGRVRRRRAGGGGGRVSALASVPRPGSSGALGVPAGTPLLELRTVESGYHKQLRVLKGVSLKLMPGTCVAVLGSNGAGKSTMLKTVMGLIDDEPRKGTVRVMGRDMTRADTERISQAGIAYVVEDRGMFPDLTVGESLRLGAYHRNDRAEVRADLERIFGYFPRLAERQKQASGTLSGGEQQMLAIARALMSRPKLLMLDEPSLGLAPLLVEEIFGVIREINRSGMGIL